MEKEKFERHLADAAKNLMDFTKTLCFNDFSVNYKFIITPHSQTVTTDQEHLNEKEISVLITWNKYEGKLLTDSEIVELLHHDNKVPVWVDISVYESRPDLTIINLYCSRRLRGEEELMHPGFPPFHLQVAMPPAHLKVQREGKFDVNWRKKRDESKKSLRILKRMKQLFR